MRPVGRHISLNSLNMTHILCHEFHTKGSCEIFFCARICLEQFLIFAHNWPWQVCLVSEAWNLGKQHCIIGEKMLRCRGAFWKELAVVWFFSVTLNYLILVCKASKCILLKNHMSSEIKKKLIMMNAFTEEEASENQAMLMPLYRSDIVWKIILHSWHPMLRPWLRSCGGDHVDVSANLRRPGNVSAGSFSE